MRFKDKVVVITGASKGIGASIAEGFAAEGAKVVINYNTSGGKAADLVTKIQSNGGEATAIQADISNLDDIKRLIDESVNIYGRLNILVNNAGQSILTPLPEVTLDEVETQFRLNVFGVIFATQEAEKHMSDGGKIINISSIGAKGFATGSVYGATKAAVNTLTKSFAAELGSRKITVNGIAPGAVETDMLVENGLAAQKEAIIARTPLGRFGQPHDITTATLFLASDDASWITGEILQVSGGNRM